MKYEKDIWYLADKLIEEFSIKDHIEPGTNGPYNDKETIVRNLSHLIIITSIYMKNKNKLEYIKLLNEMGTKLLEFKNEKGLFTLRTEKTKDTSNGVIGHAWVLEALVYLYKLTEKNEYLETATNIYKLHRFNSDLGLWNRPPLYGTSESIDYTFNHQLWFASSACELYLITKNDSIRKDIEIFIKRLPKLLTINSRGLICHQILRHERVIGSIKSHIKRYIDIANRIIDRPSYYYKETGYHLFNVFALAKIYEIFPEIEFWNTNKFKKIISYLHSKNFRKALLSDKYNKDKSLKNIIPHNYTEVNIYGYPYNVPGFEIVYVKKVFSDLISPDLVEELMEYQWRTTYDENTKMFGKNCYDKITINYRIYEYLKGIELR